MSDSSSESQHPFPNYHHAIIFVLAVVASAYFAYVGSYGASVGCAAAAALAVVNMRD